MVTAAETPFVSVIMPVRNEASFIRQSLSSVLDQTYPRNFMEIVVADGMSTDETREIIRELASGSEIDVIIVDNPMGIAPAGLNRAIERAKGDVIVRVDGHCEIDSDYVENCVKHLANGKADGVGGPIETIGSGTQAEAISIAMSSRFGVGGSAFRTVNDREMFTDTVAFPGYTREIIERVGPFNEELVRNQDDEYNFRIRKHGGKILLTPEIRSKYYSRSTFRSLWRQYFQYGYWKVRVLQLHPGQMSIRQFVPFVFVLAIILLSGLALFSEVGRWMLSGLIVLYLTANIAASFIASGGSLKLIPHLSLSFFILHLSYGLGSIFGLIAFRNRWGKNTRVSPSDVQLPKRVRSKP